MVGPQPLHRAVRTRSDTAGALLRVLVVAGILVGVLVTLGWPAGGEPPAMPAQPSPGTQDGALVLPRPPAGSR